MKQSLFVIDTIPDKSFEGYSKDDDWNGWACPFFSLEQGKKIVQAQNSGQDKSWFDEKNDQFVFIIDGQREYFPSIEIDGGRLYPIGNSSWIWEETNDK